MKHLWPPFVHAFPAPAVLIGCGTLERPNLITCSWFGTVCSEPPMVSVSVRRSRYSFQWLHEQREFSVNIPRVQDLPAVEHCGAVSGRTRNKFTDLGLTPVPCPPLEAVPMIDEFFLALACRVTDVVELGSHHMFIAEVVGVHGEGAPGGPARRPPLRPAEQLAYLDSRYWRLEPVR